MSGFMTSLAGFFLLAVLGTTTQAVIIETVPVGNLGNLADDEVMSSDGTSGYGAVDYAYNIGKYEVTAGQYCEFLNDVADSDPYGLYHPYMAIGSFGCYITRHGISGSYSYDFSDRPTGSESDWSNRPVGKVSWGDVVRFANWLHNGQGNGDTEDGAYDLSGTHPYYNPDGSISDEDGLNAALMAVTRKSGAQWFIPTEDEWYKAAYHKNDGDTSSYFDYPTSSDSEPSNNLTTPDNGNNATFHFYPSDRTIGSPYYRTEVGAHENSESPYGTFDQGGNVWEWNETDFSGSYRGYRGGSFYYAGLHDVDFLLASTRRSIPPADDYYQMGFRVASVPESGTISLLLCGLASLICWRRRK